MSPLPFPCFAHLYKSMTDTHQVAVVSPLNYRVFRDSCPSTPLFILFMQLGSCFLLPVSAVPAFFVPTRAKIYINLTHSLFVSFPSLYSSSFLFIMCPQPITFISFPAQYMFSHSHLLFPVPFTLSPSPPPLIFSFLFFLFFSSAYQTPILMKSLYFLLPAHLHSLFVTFSCNCIFHYSPSNSLHSCYYNCLLTPVRYKCFYYCSCSCATSLVFPLFSLLILIPSFPSTSPLS